MDSLRSMFGNRGDGPDDRNRSFAAINDLAVRIFPVLLPVRVYFNRWKCTRKSEPLNLPVDDPDHWAPKKIFWERSQRPIGQRGKKIFSYYFCRI